MVARSSMPVITIADFVVIDPTDRRQVEPLVRALLHRGVDCGGWRTADYPPNVDEETVLFDKVQAALRSLLPPPRPKEPTGLGAVVEDSNGRPWIRWSRGSGCVWRCAEVAAFESRTWDKVDAVRVLSEGVTA